MRPDQPLFDSVARRFEDFDRTLGDFAAGEGLSLVMNRNRHVGRILEQQDGLLLRMMRFALSDSWKRAGAGGQLLCDFELRAYYRSPAQPPLIRWVFLRRKQPLESLSGDLPGLLSEGWKELRSWTPPARAEPDREAFTGAWTANVRSLVVRDYPDIRERFGWGG